MSKRKKEEFNIVEYANRLFSFQEKLYTTETKQKDKERVKEEMLEKIHYEKEHKKLNVNLSQFKQSDLDRFFLRQSFSMEQQRRNT